MNESQRVGFWQTLCRNNLWLQQFGQGNDSASFDGKTGCGFCILQTLILGWKGKRVTHNTLATIARYPTTLQKTEMFGLYESQIKAIISYYKLPYVVVKGWTSQQIRRIANTRGPVAFGMMYGWQPEWYGKIYAGVRADGKPNGFASPRGKAGKTQLKGFETGPHLELLLGYHVLRDAAGNPTHRTHHVKDPNHGSASRPEKPPFDDISEKQFDLVYNSYTRSPLNRTRYAIIPTVAFNR